MADVLITIEGNWKDKWRAVLVDNEHNVNMVIGHGRTPQAALDSLIADVLESSSNRWIEERRNKNAAKEGQEQKDDQPEHPGNDA